MLTTYIIREVKGRVKCYYNNFHDFDNCPCEREEL
jgi:hypothetical protein